MLLKRKVEENVRGWESGGQGMEIQKVTLMEKEIHLDQVVREILVDDNEDMEDSHTEDSDVKCYDQSE